MNTDCIEMNVVAKLAWWSIDTWQLLWNFLLNTPWEWTDSIPLEGILEVRITNEFLMASLVFEKLHLHLSLDGSSGWHDTLVTYRMLNYPSDIETIEFLMKNGA